MELFRFKISFKDDPKIYRVIDIAGNHTFFDFHLTILKSVSFEEGELASFILNAESVNERIEISLSEMQYQDIGLLMKDVKIKDIVDDSNKELTYIYDFLNLWTFHVEFQSKGKLETKATYPKVVKSVGEIPEQSSLGMNFNEELTNEDASFLRNLKNQNENLFLGDDSDINDDIDEEDEDY